METGTIFNIKRFEIHDGPGIRTTVFLKGCPLRCLWCHNPEGMSKAIQTDSRTGKPFGRIVTAEEILPELLEDRLFYETSEGGVTLSGGEPLLQPKFAAELLKLLKKEHIHTAVDTSLYVKDDVLDDVLPLADIFLVDVKAMDDAVHRELTGVSNRKILENLQNIDAFGKPYEIRIPLIPGKNENQIPGIGAFLASLGNVGVVRLLAYHDLGRSKYEALGMDYPMGDARLSAEAYETAFQTLVSCGLNVIHKA